MPKKPEKEETAEAISCPSRSRTDEACRTEHPNFEKRPANVRSRDKRICRLVLLGTAPRLQSHRCSAIPNPLGTTTPRSNHDQPTVGCGQARGI